MGTRRRRAALYTCDFPHCLAHGRVLRRNLAAIGIGSAAAPFATNVSSDFFSNRIGCQIHQPNYGISLAALCVRDE